MMRLLSLLSVASLLLAGPLPLRAQEVDYSGHFRVFTGDGQPVSLDDVVEAMAGAEAVLVGETHTDPVGHWLEAELFRRALDRFKVGEESGALRPVALSLEFFERDVQDVLDEYLAGLISEEQFLDAARPATYYASDHRPMVEEAKARGLPVIASNAPRRYVNRVSRGGREALNDLPPSARRFLPPLPYPQSTEAYRAEWTELMSNMTMEDQCPAPEEVAGEEEEESAAEMPPPHGVAARPDSAPSTPHGMPPSPHGPPGGMPASFIENGLHAQTLWDASMAYAITTYLRLNPGAMVFHVVGGFHVENFTGTPEKVQYYRPGTRTLVVSMELAEDVESFDPEEHGGLGDFVILTDEALDENIARNCAPEGEGG
jgi:uncharacterized iron-regulated protein